MENSKEGIGGGRDKDSEATLLDHYNDCIVALDILFEAAENGSSSAEIIISDFAERLIRCAATYEKWQSG